MARPLWRVCGIAVLAGLSSSCPAQTADQGTRPALTTDGGTRQTLESIFIPPKPDAPFSLTLATESSRPMVGGGTVTFVNERHIMRDSAGRIYQERWLLVPKGSDIKSEMNWIQITDPNAHTLYNCAPRLKKCFLQRYAGSVEKNYTPSTHASGPLPRGDGILVHEDLGSTDVAGLPVTGVRETTTISAGRAGNDQPMITEREFWYSAQLGVNLKSELVAPMSGKQVFTVTELSTTEPEASFFTLPAGYTVVDQRTPDESKTEE